MLINNYNLIFRVYKNNIAFKGYELSLFVDSKYINLLYEKDILEKLLTKYEFSNNRLFFIYNLLAIRDQTKYSKEIEELIINAKEMVIGLAEYLKVYLNVYDKNNLDLNTISLIENISKYGIQESNSGLIIDRLLDFYKKYEEKNIIFLAIKKLAKNKSNYLAKSIVKKIINLNIENNDFKEFVKDYIFSLSDKYYYKDEIVTLVKHVDWTDNVAEYHELLNRLSEYDLRYFDYLPNNPVGTKDLNNKEENNDE